MLRNKGLLYENLVVSSVASVNDFQLFHGVCLHRVVLCGEHSCGVILAFMSPPELSYRPMPFDVGPLKMPGCWLDLRDLKSVI